MWHELRIHIVIIRSHHASLILFKHYLNFVQYNSWYMNIFFSLSLAHLLIHLSDILNFIKKLYILRNKSVLFWVLFHCAKFTIPWTISHFHWAINLTNFFWETSFVVIVRCATGVCFSSMPLVKLLVLSSASSVFVPPTASL